MSLYRSRLTSLSSKTTIHLVVILFCVYIWRRRDRQLKFCFVISKFLKKTSWAFIRRNYSVLLQMAYKVLNWTIRKTIKKHSWKPITIHCVLPAEKKIVICYMPTVFSINGHKSSVFYQKCLRFSLFSRSAERSNANFEYFETKLRIFIR